MKGHILILLLPFGTIRGRPVNRKVANTTLNHIVPPPHQGTPLHPQSPTVPLKTSSPIHQPSENDIHPSHDKTIAIDRNLGMLEKEVTEEQIKKIRARFLGGASIFYSLSPTLASRIRVAVGEVHSLETRKDRAVKYYEDFSVKLGALTREAIERRKREVENDRITNYVKNLSARFEPENPQDRTQLLQDQREAYAKGGRLTRVLGDKVINFVKQDLQELTGTSELQRTEIHEHAMAYAKHHNIIDDEVLAQRKIAMKSKRSSSRRDKVRESKVAAAETVKTNQKEITFAPGDGTSFKIKLPKSMDEMQRLYAEGKKMSRVFHAGIANQIRLKRQFAGHETTPAQMGKYLESLAVQIGLATQEEISQRRSVRQRLGYDDRTYSMIMKKKEMSQVEESSRKRPRFSSNGGKKKAVKKGGGGKGATKTMQSLHDPSLKEAGNDQTATSYSSSSAVPSSSTLGAHNPTPRLGSDAVQPTTMTAPLPSPSSSDTHQAFNLPSHHDPNRNLFLGSHHDALHPLFSSSYTHQAPHENNLEPDHHFVYYPQPGSPMFAGDVLHPHEDFEWRH